MPMGIIERSIVWHGLKQLVSSCYLRWRFGDLVLKGKTIIRHIIQEIIRQITHFRHQWTPLCLPWTIPVATPVVSTMGSKSKLGSMLSIRNGAQLFLCKIWHNYAKGSKPLAKPPSKKEKLLLEAKDNYLPCSARSSHPKNEQKLERYLIVFWCKLIYIFVGKYMRVIEKNE